MSCVVCFGGGSVVCGACGDKYPPGNFRALKRRRIEYEDIVDGMGVGSKHVCRYCVTNAGLLLTKVGITLSGIHHIDPP